VADYSDLSGNGNNPYADGKYNADDLTGDTNIGFGMGSSNPTSPVGYGIPGRYYTNGVYGDTNNPYSDGFGNYAAGDAYIGSGVDAADRAQPNVVSDPDMPYSDPSNLNVLADEGQDDQRVPKRMRK
jgi:hypothetical protein